MARTVKDIEKDVSRLSPIELAKFRAWYQAFDGAAWDKQIEADLANGKLDKIAEAAVAEYHAGNKRKL